MLSKVQCLEGALREAQSALSERTRELEVVSNKCSRLEEEVGRVDN